MGYKGGIAYVQGLMTTTNAQQHWAGVQAALKKYPNVKLLAVEPGNWDEQTAFNLAQTWLSKYGTSLNAISSANDEMALGIQEAVRAVGRVGPASGKNQVFITGADGTPAGVQNVAQGNWVATALFDSFWQGVVGIGLAYKAAVGQINPNKLTHLQRAFNGPYYIITKANTAQYLHNFPNPKSYNFKNLWSLAQSQVTT
jgi:ribose transport system substrate-binding protein